MPILNELRFNNTILRLKFNNNDNLTYKMYTIVTNILTVLRYQHFYNEQASILCKKIKETKKIIKK